MVMLFILKLCPIHTSPIWRWHKYPSSRSDPPPLLLLNLGFPTKNINMSCKHHLSCNLYHFCNDHIFLFWSQYHPWEHCSWSPLFGPLDLSQLSHVYIQFPLLIGNTLFRGWFLQYSALLYSAINLVSQVMLLLITSSPFKLNIHTAQWASMRT